MSLDGVSSYDQEPGGVTQEPGGSGPGDVRCVLPSRSRAHVGAHARAHGLTRSAGTLGPRDTRLRDPSRPEWVNTLPSFAEQTHRDHVALFCPEAQAAGASELPRALQSPLAGEPQTRLPAQNPPRCLPVCSGITLPTPRRSLDLRCPDSWVPRAAGCMPPAVPTSRCRVYGRVGPAPSPPEGLPFLDPGAAPTGSPRGLAPLAASWSPLSSEGSLWNGSRLAWLCSEPPGLPLRPGRAGPSHAGCEAAGWLLLTSPPTFQPGCRPAVPEHAVAGPWAASLSTPLPGSPTCASWVPLSCSRPAQGPHGPVWCGRAFPRGVPAPWGWELGRVPVASPAHLSSSAAVAGPLPACASGCLPGSPSSHLGPGPVCA